MKNSKIGILGDYNPEYPLHLATGESIRHAASALGLRIDFEWLATDAAHDYGSYQGLWCSPGSPYRSLDGALAGIRYARENELPFFGTCGGFQHAVLEFARNVAGLTEAAHAEYTPDAPTAVVYRLTCSLVGKDGEVNIKPGSLAGNSYGRLRSLETYRCSYGMNPAWQPALEKAGMMISGYDAEGGPRILELPTHRFFVATAFVPQAWSRADAPHPLIVAFCRAAAGVAVGASAPQ